MKKGLSFLLVLALAASFWTFACPGKTAAAADYKVDISALNGKKGVAEVMNGYPDASYPVGTWVINFKGVGEAFLSLGKMDLSQYNKVTLTVGSSAAAVFDNPDGKAFVALTSNGATTIGNKNEGFQAAPGAKILAKANLMPPPGRYGAGEQVLEIPLDTKYSGEVYLSFHPSIRDNKGSPTADMIIVSSITFSGKAQEPEVVIPVEEWALPEGLELTDSLDFEDCTEGDLGSDVSDLSVLFDAPRGKVTTVVADPEGGLQLSIDSADYFSAQLWDVMENKPYVFSFDAQMTSTKYCFFIRGTQPVTRENPAWKEAAIGWYESDWYTENGGTQGISTTGASGIALRRGNTDKTLALCVKTYAEDGIYITSQTFQIPVGVDVVKTVQSYHIYDDGAGTIKYFVAGKLFAIVEYAGETAYDDPADDDLYPFYKSVTVKDAYGNEIGKVENSRLSAEGVIAIGFRKDEKQADGILDQIALYRKPQEEETPTPEETTAPEVTPAPTAEPTAEPKKEEKKSSAAGGILAVCGGVAAIAAITVGVILFIKKKK